MTRQPATGNPGAGGAWADDETRITLGAIARWKQTAADEVDNIGGWRDADPGDRLHKFWSDPARQRGTEHGSTMPNSLFGDTGYLVSWVVSNLEKLDPAPLQDIYDAIAAWHDDHNAERVPEQRVLVRKLDRAIQVVQAVENAVRWRIRRPTGEATGSSVWEQDRRRLRYLVTEMRHRIAAASCWRRLSAINGLQDEAGTLAMKLGFPGEPLRLIRHAKGEPDFEKWVSSEVPDAVDILRFALHDPLGQFSTGVLGCTRPGEIHGKAGLIEVDFIFDLWKPDAIKSLEAWARAIDGLRTDTGLPFRYPRANALSGAMGEAARACAVYAVTLEMLIEPLLGAAATPESSGAAYAPPEQCLPPESAELLEMRAKWESHRDTLEAGMRERFRRLDMYFVTRMELDEAAARCQVAADGAAAELEDGGKAASEQTTTRVRSALAAIRERVRPWYELRQLMLPETPGGIPKDPAGEAAAVQELSQRLQSLTAEIRPIAEQRRATAARTTTPGDASGKNVVEADGRNGSPVHKPDGWTKAELLAQANEDGKILSASKFDTIRGQAKVKAAPKGGAGPHHKYSIADLKKLIAEVEGGGYRKSGAIAEAWRELLGSDEPAANPK